MKIGFIMGYYSIEKIGGSEVQAMILAENLFKSGNEIFFLCSGNEKKEIGKNVLYKIYRVKETYKGIRILHYLRRKKIIDILEKEKPDILYHRGRIDLADITYRYAKKNNIPTVTCITSMRHTIKPNYKFSSLLPIKIIDYHILKKSYELSSIIISQTKEEKDSLIKNLGYKSIVIPNGHKIPEDKFIKDKPISVIWVANVKPLKQIEIFIELARRNQHRNIKFIIIGYFEETEYKEKIMKKINKSNNINYLGGLNLEKTNEYISKASILIQTSEENSEGFPNTFIQAWLREVPVISLHCNPDGIITSEGLGFHSGNFEQMVKDLEYLLDNPEIIKKMGEKCREYAIDNYDENRILKKYIHVFNNLIKR